jgi:hypothetical protein
MADDFVFLVNGIEHRKRKRSPTSITTGQQENHREKRISAVKSKETLEQIQFREFVSQIESILLLYYRHVL